MSELDENLTSILSSLIETDVIEAPNTGELPDNSSFTDSRLDFDNLASCITGNDASLHQTSDENVSSLLESHLNELEQSENTDIVESTTENLDDVTPFDLDKPIESLLETTSSEFISQECNETEISIGEKTLDSEIISTNLNLPLDETKEDDSQPILNTLNSNGIEDTNSTSQSNIEQSSTFSQCHETFNETQTLNELNEANGQTSEIIESNSDIENQGIEHQSCDAIGSGEEEPCETITADTIANDILSIDSNSKQEHKKRRRILVYNDGESDSSELDGERERLLQSNSPTLSHHSEAELPEHENDRLNDENLNLSNDEHIDDDYIRSPNEKPGPKSKKQSTHLYNALKAKALLESAIVIPARKKKKRVIDSDDEFGDFTLNQPIANVDDIGLITEDNNIQMPFNVSIEIEQKNSIVYVKKEDDIDIDIDIDTKPIINNLPMKHELDDERANVNEPAFVKVEPISRTAIQVKMEKYNANNNRRSHKRKEPRDIFGISLNAPYVDSSSDEDYFPANATSSRRHQHNHSQHWNNKAYLANQRKKKGHIPDDVYFNAKVPLHVLYSYDDSSSDGEKSEFPVTNSVQLQKTSFQPTKRTLNKMPPVHKIISRQSHGKTSIHKVVSKQSSRSVKSSQPASKPTVFEQLDKLKRFLRASGIKVNVNELLKGSKTFQERCERIRNILHRSGIEGEPTMAKCKKLKKQLKLKEEIAGLDTNVIIESKEDDGRPKRSTRRATRRNYVFDEQAETKQQQEQPEIKEEASQLLQKMKEFIDSDSEYEGEQNNQNTNNVDFSNMVEAIISTNDVDALPEQILNDVPSTQELNSIQTAINVSPVNAQCTTTL